MKTLLLLLPFPLLSQTLTPTLSYPFSYPGSTVLLTANLLDPNGNLSMLTGLQWIVFLPPGVTFGTPSRGPTAPADVTFTCSGTTCGGTVSPTTTYKTGVIMTVPLIFAATAPTSGTPVQIAFSAITSTNIGTPVTVTSPAPAPLIIAPTGRPQNWFNVTIGQATCATHKWLQTPIKIDWTCSNLYGANSGSFTASLADGGLGADYFDFGINSFSVVGSPVPDAFLRCTIQVNATSTLVIMQNGAPVPADSVAYSCSGFSESGAKVLSWP